MNPLVESYLPLAIDELAKTQSSEVGSLLKKIVSEFDRGLLKSPPITVYSLSEAPSVFSAMAKGQHLGKIVFNWKNFVA